MIYGIAASLLYKRLARSQSGSLPLVRPGSVLSLWPVAALAGSNSSRTRFPSTICRVNSLASFPNRSTGFFGCLVSGVSTPMSRTRSPLCRRRVSPSTTRSTTSKSPCVAVWSAGLKKAARSATRTIPGRDHFQERRRATVNDGARFMGMRFGSVKGARITLSTACRQDSVA
jgi:hypothetical protein